MGRIIRQRPIPPSERAEGVTIEEQGGAIVVRSGGWPGATLRFDEASELFPGASRFDLIDGAVIVRNFSRFYLDFPENVGPLDVELELFPCGVVSLVPGVDRGDPPVRVRFPVIEYTAAELVAGDQPMKVADLGAASETLGTSFVKPYFLTDNVLGGIAYADEAFVLDFYAYKNADQVEGEAVYVGGWSVIDNTTTNRAELVLEEGGLTRSVDGIRMAGPVLIPPFGGFLKIRKTIAGDLHNVSVRVYTRSR